MFASFKRLFFKDTEEVLATSIPEPVAFTPTHDWAMNTDKPSAMASSSQIPPGKRSNFAPVVEEDCIALPLESVFARLPNSLASFVQSQGSGFVSIPARRILQELPKGSVKLSFGELRVAAPPGTFSENAGHDQVLVELPLNQILMRIPASLLSRRPGQKHVEVSSEVKDIFGKNGESISISAAPVSTPKFVKPITQPTIVPTPLAPAAPIAMPQVAKTAPIKIVLPTTNPAPSASAPVAFRVLPDQPADKNNGKVLISLLALSESWPEMVQTEISGSNLNGAKVALPMDKLEQGLRAGKIVFTWKQICGWIEPNAHYHSEIEDLPLELPLKIIAPLFMAKHRPAKVQKQIFVGDAPDLFAGRTPRIDPVAPTIVAPPPSSLPMTPSVPRLVMAEPLVMAAPPETAPPTRVEAKPIVLETAPANMVHHDLSPQAIVRNLAAQPEIAGAFITMQDGLLVAAELPAHLKAETVAAFLPQIFGRMNLYTKELQLGAVSSLTFVVENVTWQIVKSGTVYLVALGKPGESLPGSKLNTLAAQLSRQIN